ncbi:hypothetical protein PQ455_01360 [Sphingomonas naphthae]|uniref:Uncharacterized protein n=1 Tax=Sphingomonas naphthae TaxID=1813468 RepID=A0ABY7TL66_9SPHN|nr:hypothetical protein [Sphingomonas naphthae]WCT73909.1 hypothetical protein PQ455_01360 [Sphingomonas naphthae]
MIDDWDREVELFWQPAGQLRIWREKMTLRQALDAFASLPPSVQDGAGIGLHDPIAVVIEGRPALVGWYNAQVCREIAALMPAGLESC